MSLRRTPADAGKVDHATEIRKTIEHARLAHDSFMRSNPGISAVMTDAEKEFEGNRPFVLELSQQFDSAQMQFVEISISLSGGSFSRLAEMSVAVTDLFAPIFTGAGFSVIDGGTLNKVCTNPPASSTSWKFSKNVDAATRQAINKQEGNYYVLPSGDGNALTFMVTSFQVTADRFDQANSMFVAMVGDNVYKFEPAASELGRSVSFRLIPQ